MLLLAARQPARPDRRRHRHRQDGDAADAGRGLLRRRRAGVLRRREGRPLGHRRGRRSQPEARWSAPRRSASTDYEPAPSRSIFWDLFGEKGHPVRTTVSEMGPLLLARLLELNDTQEGVLNIVFKVADDEGLLLLDLKDLRALLTYRRRERRASSTHQYGNVSAATVGTIQRELLALEQQGGEHFFGEPALDSPT